MPLHAGVHANRVVRAFLEGLLPDSQAVRERWGATYGVSANNPFALLRHVGRDAAGAVQILPAEEASPDAAQRIGDIDWLTEDEFATLVRDLAEHRADWNPGRYSGRWSLAGAQSKVALYRDGVSGAWGIPKDSTPTTHIIKPALDGFDDHHINEVLCQRAAGQLGLPAAVSELIEFDDVRAIVSTRYDRTRDEAGRLTVFTRRTFARLSPSIPARNTRLTADQEWVRSPTSSRGSVWRTARPARAASLMRWPTTC